MSRPVSGPEVRPARLRTLVPRALVLVVLAGGTWAFVIHDKAVRLSVDGRQRTLHTFAGGVDELLAREGVRLGPHDAVSPPVGIGRPLVHGDEVAVRRGRPLELTVDDRRRPEWTTEDTVGEALRELGVDTAGAHLSVPPWTEVPLHGLALRVRTERTVTVVADGRRLVLRTTAGTVREAVAEAGVELRERDTTSLPPDGFPRGGSVIRVERAGDARAAGEAGPFPA
ncbi:ubiquitin-like domain-containing protein [Streptomyces zingiberis]|uniref:ubiquitin-like domain-containing protein n=1 Tax=Streptomyces zingiberis TaxID=2053010 RepID=UPI0028933D7E|nr:ubiquitin-like domain-containing protein [Streptomyces zingiberis]